jgi:hypothetical protein
VLDGAAEQGITLRTLGGLAIFLHAPTDLAEWADQLRAIVEEAPKSSKRKLRDRIGDRKCWYELPEEVG